MKIKLLVILMAILFTCSYCKAFTTSSDRCYGLFTGSEINSETISQKTKLYGVKPCIIMLFWSWDDYPFNIETLQTIWNAGSIPLITLEPWYAKDKKAVPLKNILTGKEDKFLIGFGKAVKNFGHPFFIRFAHEMNGNWYPWSGEKNEKNSKNYIDAYRHVHDVIKRSAGNVLQKWIWSINSEDIPKKDWNKANNYYPGDNYVDAIGLDGYNWGNTREWSQWMLFDNIFNETFKMIEEQHPTKPVFITEISTTSNGGDRPKWIKDLYKQLNDKYNPVQILIWFDMKKECDWRVDTDESSLKSFKNGLKKSFTGNRKELLKFF